MVEKSARREEYPLMSKIARKYIAVQGTFTPAERVISRLGTILTKRRQRLTGEMFSKMMFLTVNFLTLPYLVKEPDVYYVKLKTKINV